jgi:hypothetical protein
MSFPCTEDRQGVGGVIARWLRSSLREALREPSLGRAALGLPGEASYVSPVRVLSLANLHLLGSRQVEGGRLHRVHVDARVEFLFSRVPDHGLGRVREILERPDIVESRAVTLTVVLDVVVDEAEFEITDHRVVALAGNGSGAEPETLIRRRAAV